LKKLREENAMNVSHIVSGPVILGMLNMVWHFASIYKRYFPNQQHGKPAGKR